MAIDLILEGIQTSDLEVILNVITSRFIIDYGSVLANNGDGTVDVQHAVPFTPKYPPQGFTPSFTTTHGVEVLFLSGANFSTSFQLQVGDPVLLVGLKDFVKSTASLPEAPNTPSAFQHYNQNTLKAIPLAASNAMAQVQINVVSPPAPAPGPSLLQIKNQAQSLATILETFSTQGSPVYHMVAPDTIAKLRALLTP